ncbi:SGNH/GDSL hydrolase family protein [Dietzia psychralcaliphila]|uniref:SGNH/GDSL hydrolase family protein n=1 Tax=Dietzia psychralcaliphila TaxID=139021 RepID=UPI001C1DFA24|nr:SGNH/GDSL hydrolase family protein [Dietzia psychralcaliphila]
MLTPLRRRAVGSRTLTTSLALAASLALAVAPVAAAQSTTQTDGTIAVGSLGSTAGTPLPASGSLGSLAQPAYADYVALGDSYAALGDSRESAGGPAACNRSLANYPNLLDPNPAVGDLTDATCGGAQIPDLAGSQSAGVPPQFDALNSTTDLVTLSIGGNDVGFGTIVGCITQGALPTDPRAPRDCRAELGGTVASDITEVFGDGGEIDEVYAAIGEAAPGATVIATQYMPLMPESDEDGCAFTDALTEGNLQWAREVAESINDAVDDAAQRNGHISVLPTDEVDRSACAPADQRWTDFLGGAPTYAAGMHPTALGQQAMADAIAAAI